MTKINNKGNESIRFLDLCIKLQMAEKVQRCLWILHGTPGVLDQQGKGVLNQYQEKNIVLNRY